MKLASRVKPISYLKANASDVLSELESDGPLVVTQRGEAKAVLQDIGSYEATQETLALLKILAIGNAELERGEVTPAAEVFRRLRNRSKA
jgi:prevent-host-death family protein